MLLLVKRYYFSYHKLVLSIVRSVFHIPCFMIYETSSQNRNAAEFTAPSEES
jgi:hypothetical protein